MQNFLDINIAVLKRRNPKLAEAVAACANSPELQQIEPVVSKTGEPVPKVSVNGKQLFVHSRFNPEEEAARFAANAGKQDLYIVFGFGFGFHVEALLATAPANALVIVLEKQPAMLRAAFTHRDLSAALKDGRLVVIAEPTEEDVSTAVKGHSSARTTFFMHRGSHQLDETYYSSLHAMCRSWLSTKEVNIATLARFEKLWSSNIARNIANFINLPSAKNFYGKFAEMPAIVVAAGPSLSESLDFIRANKNKAVIIAVDTAMRILAKAGVHPHFCIAADPQILNARYFEGLPQTETVLIADPTVHPATLRLHKGRAAFTSIAFDLMKWIENICGERGALTHGGSVSTNAFDFARRLGCSPIILTGQDLAFTEGRAHAKGSYMEEQVFLRINRLFNQEMHNRAQLNALPKIKMQGILSQQVTTNQKMTIFMGWFQKQKCEYLINATKDGALLSGIKHCAQSDIELKELNLSLPDVIADCMNTAQKNKNAAKEISSASAAMLAEAEALTPVLAKAQGLAGDLAKLVKDGKQDQGKTNYILQKLNSADRMIEEAKEVKGLLTLVSQKAIHTINEGYDAAAALPPELAAAERSEYLYREFYESCLFVRKVLTVIIQILAP